MCLFQNFIAIPAEKRQKVLEGVIKRLMTKKNTHNDNFVGDKLKENNSYTKERKQTSTDNILSDKIIPNANISRGIAGRKFT